MGLFFVKCCIVMIRKKTYRINDQKKFSFFSGDFNPIHLDKNESTKTHAGQPIVHGVHLVLWALDIFNIELRIGTTVSINFKSQVNLNEQIQATYDQDRKKILITNFDKSLTFCILKIKKDKSIKETKLNNSKVPTFTDNTIPDDLEFESILLNKKNYDICGGKDLNLGTSLFPFLAKDIGLNTLYEIACLSSIVGMKVPGKHSLFLDLVIYFSDKNNPRNYFMVKSKHEILKLISLNYTGVNLNADIKTIYRPQSSETKSIDNLKAQYKCDDSLRQKKVLVIGGSRGIGAYVTKLCAIMGAEVFFTYNSNKGDANSIKKEAMLNEYNVNYARLDITNIEDIYNFKETFDHIYYFATPKIMSNESGVINEILMDKYNLFYVKSFIQVVEHFISINKYSKFLYPSTSYIDENRNDFKEYILSKLEGEKTCINFNRKLHNSILFPRIPPLNTDQNLSILPKKNKNTSDYAHKLIRVMNGETIEF